MRIGVLGGPSGVPEPALAHAARLLGADLGRRCWALVTGVPGPIGADLAGAAASGGGDVIEVLPRGAEPALASSERRRVDDPAARTAAVHLLSDAVVVLPGGVDVLAVLLDLLTRQALGLSITPCGVLDPEAVLDPLAEQLAALECCGQLSAPLLRDSQPSRLADRLAAGASGELGGVG